MVASYSETRRINLIDQHELNNGPERPIEADCGVDLTLTERLRARRCALQIVHSLAT